MDPTVYGLHHENTQVDAAQGITYETTAGSDIKYKHMRTPPGLEGSQ